MDEIRRLIGEKRYFVLHALRQTGKTSCLLALMAKLNAEADYTALYVNLEPAQAARGNLEAGMRIILDALVASADEYLADRFLPEIAREILTTQAAPLRPPEVCSEKGCVVGAEGSRSLWSCSWMRWIAWWEIP